MNIKKVIMYLLEWLIPSSTAVYIVLATKFIWGTYLFWGYAMNVPAYIIACIAGAIIYYPINKYIFKNCQSMNIKINGKDYKVKEGMELDIL